MSNRNNKCHDGIQKILDIPLRERVYEQIKNLILMNKLYPGQTIVIDHLAADLGLSQTPVREALVMLELDGLVTTSQYRNPRVFDIKPNDIEELYDMRLLLEPWAIQHSIDHINPDQIIEIEKDLKFAYEEAGRKNFDPHLDVDIRLHGLIMSSTGNQFFWQIASRVNDRIIRIRSLFEAIGTESEIQSIIDEHFRIIDAIKNQDKGKAAEYLYNHLAEGKARTLNALNRLPASED